ncbi:response regulator, partial [Pseudomonas syringae]
MTATSVETPILIVEDEPTLASLMRDYLTAAGYSTHCLSNGLDVVPAVTSNAPQLNLLGIPLPARAG